VTPEMMLPAGGEAAAAGKIGVASMPASIMASVAEINRVRFMECS
jgi:hypothetical protein